MEALQEIKDIDLDISLRENPSSNRQKFDGLDRITEKIKQLMTKNICKFINIYKLSEGKKNVEKKHVSTETKPF